MLLYGWLWVAVVVAGWLWGCCGCRALIIQMSTLGRRQLAPFEKAFKYEFTLEILWFSCKVPTPCKFKFMWRRNSKSIETKADIDLKHAVRTELTVNEKLSSISTIILNTDTRQFLPKESELIVNMVITGSHRKLASCSLDMRCILDPNDHKAPRSEVFKLAMTNHYAKNEEFLVSFRLSSIFKEEIVCSERSLGNASLNMSGLSMQQEGRFFEKRYDLPSKDGKDKDTHSVMGKDTHSVTSYNPNRYPSAKREREDSSIRKFDYGYLASLKNNNELDTRSKRSHDNKTEVNEANYSRQLADEQTRRSKAEAELAKNRVEIEELKRKLAELSIDNLQLKSAPKEDPAMQTRLYDLTKELSTLREHLETALLTLQRTEGEAKTVRAEKAFLESELQKRQKRVEALETAMRALEGAQTETAELRYQLESARRATEEVRRQAQEREGQLLAEKHRDTQEAAAKLEAVRRENDRLRATVSSTSSSNATAIEALHRRTSEAERETKEKTAELTTKTRYIIEIERELEEHRGRLAQHQAEKAFMQREIIKLKQEASRPDLQQRNQGLRSDLARVQEQLAASLTSIEERQRIIARLQQEITSAQAKSSHLLQQVNEAQKRANELEEECRRVREGHSKEGSGEDEALFRETLQLQVELKFARDELERLRGVEEAVQQQRWKAEREAQERTAAEGELERVERELTSKNRALMIEVEKTKMMTEQINEMHYTCDLLREELDKSRSIIHSGQQQLSAFENELHHLTNAHNALQAELNRTAADRQALTAKGEEARQLEVKVRELEERNHQKLASLEASNRSLMLAHREAKESQRLAEERLQLLATREKQLADAEARAREGEASRAAQEAEVARFTQERRMLEKRMEMVMEEMHSMKKRYEEEKGRSVSFTRNEDLHRLRSMEGELEKKEKAVSRLSKEKLELEEENVKMNVQIMKLLSELEKHKATNSSSLKFISQLK